MRRNNQYYIRKAHRWLGVSIGIQFILWTISGLYFSWSDIDEIHGDHFLQDFKEEVSLSTLSLSDSMQVSDLSLRVIDGSPYLWVNDSLLVHASSGSIKAGTTSDEAVRIAEKYVKDKHVITSVKLLESVGPHHEYRGRPLPVWAISFEGEENLVAYISQRDGSFQRVRHQEWRWFDFLWMFHTMDYQGRDDFNNLLLRIFSLMGLITVASGFTLFFVSKKRHTIKK